MDYYAIIWHYILQHHPLSHFMNINNHEADHLLTFTSYAGGREESCFRSGNTRPYIYIVVQYSTKSWWRKWQLGYLINSIMSKRGYELLTFCVINNFDHRARSKNGSDRNKMTNYHMPAHNVIDIIWPWVWMITSGYSNTPTCVITAPGVSLNMYCFYN